MRARILKPLLTCCLALALTLVLAVVAAACPTCKDNLAHNGQNLARGFYYSILFMLSMPFLIFGGLCSYFYWEVRRARRHQRIAGYDVAAPGSTAANASTS
jgi:heme/copper-type cytochrome/quinol oxidase subunit 2